MPATDDSTGDDPPDGRAAQDDTPGAEELESRAVPATVRRAPRYRSFVLLGVLVGVVAAVVLVLVTRTERSLLVATVVFVALGLALAGALLGGLVAVLLDRPRRSRGR